MFAAGNRDYIEKLNGLVAGTLAFTAISINGPVNNGLTITDGTYSGRFTPSSLGGIALFATSNHPLIFGVNNGEAARLTATGLGIGVAPRAWAASFRGIDTGNDAFCGGGLSNSTYISQNWYYDTASKYIANGFGLMYEQNKAATVGAHIWYTAANNALGAGAAMTLVEGMRLNATGLGIGGISAVNQNANGRTIQIHNGVGSHSELRLTTTATGSAASNGGIITHDGTVLYLWNFENSYVSLGANAVEVIRVNSGGGTRTDLNGFNIEIGPGQASDTTVWIDFHAAEATYSDYALRVIRSAGANGNSQIAHRGTGVLLYTCQDSGAYHEWQIASTRQAALGSEGFFIRNSTGTAIADEVCFYSSDLSPGNTIPSFYCEGTAVVQSGQPDVASSRRITMRFNGTAYDFLVV